MVLLAREFTETMEIDGDEFEVWLKRSGARHAAPKRGRHMASGFLVAGDGDAYLVTAAHTARRMDRAATLSIATGRGRRAVLRLADLQRSGPPRWVTYGDADAAVLRIRRPPAVLRHAALPADVLDARPNVLWTSECIVMGFPLGLSAEAFAPILLRAHGASGIVRFQGNGMHGPADFLFLDRPTLGGCSGGPVFVLPAAPGAAPACVGLVSQTVSDESGGHFTAIVPAFVIRRVLAKASRR